nr:hypothetical protein [Haemophilus parahaemolyticus]
MSVHLPTAEMVELTKKTKIIDDLLGGTATMRKAAQTYLSKWKWKSPIVTANALSVRPLSCLVGNPFANDRSRIL